MLFYVIAVFVIVMDQLSKYLIRFYIDINETFTLWGIQLTHIENSGMAGGLLPGYARLFGIVAVLFVIGVLYLRRTGEMSGTLIDCSFGFLVGGAIGNGIDRLLFGQVTDFITRSGGILNLADHAIEIGVVLLIIYGIVDWLKNKPRSFCKSTE
ncbi:signal peptidase II [Bacillus sp. B15-48]|uniref:signal peptidase II n=1 Tax=Bacillus sp. B15-48 TaxID=1548601 RepID=UPI00193ECF67|nr:signal peptidase II [Bacillus sp. B15-48]MBM4764602.1 signal peptidase II [Bacillus sp. B15-48]